MKKFLTIAMVTCAVLTVAVYAASCHCADPTPPPAPPPAKPGEGSPNSPLPPAGERGQGLGVHRSAIIRAFDSETEMNRWNRGYGATEDTQISAGTMRRTLGLMNFGLRSGRSAVEGWQTTAAMPFNRYAHASVVLNGFVYVIGGCSAPTCQTIEKTVFFARVNADGSLGTWSGTTDLPTNLYGHAAVANNGRVYVTGGGDIVYVAVSNPDGTLGAWAETTRLPTSRFNHASVAYSGYLYVLGGFSAGALSSVDFAPIKPDGMLGNWATTFDLPTARDAHSVVAYDGYLYTTGGSGGSATLVQYSKINADGTIAAWSNAATLPGAGRFFHKSLAYNGNLYLTGGNNESVVLHIPINADGSLGTTWTVGTSFGETRQQHTSIVHDGFLYVVGGIDTGTNIRNSVKFAPIRPDGSVGTTWVKGAPLPSPLMGHATAVYNGFAYVTGGCTDATCSGGAGKTVSFAPILPDGTTGTWQATTPFTNGRWLHGAVAHRGYLYVTGGCSAAACGGTASVEFAPVNPDGTLGNWGPSFDLPATRFQHTLAAHEGRLYVAGGDVGGTLSPSTLFITQNTDGSLNSAGWSTGTNLPGARKSHASVVYNTKLYVLGGSSGAVESSVYFAGIKPDGSLDTWGSTTSFPTPRMSLSAGAHNGLLYVAGGEDGAGTNGSVHAGRLNPDGTIQAGSWSVETSIAPRRLHAGFSHGGYLFATGGCLDLNCQTMTSDSLSAPMNANGEFSEPHLLPALPASRFWHGMAAWKDCLYITGGHDGSGPLNTVYYAKAGADGAVPGWIAGPVFLSPRYGHESVAVNGYLYVIGGFNNTSYLRDVQVTAINEHDCSPNGWSTVQQLPEPLAYVATASYNGRIYVMGGFGGAYSAKVYHSTVNSDGTLGAWTAATDLPTAVSDLEAAAHGGHLYAIGGENGSNPRNEVLFAKTNADGSIGAWTPTTPFDGPRYAFTSLMNGGFIYIFGGTGATGPVADIQSAPLNSDGSVGTWTGVGALAAAEYRFSAAATKGWAFAAGGNLNPTGAASGRLTAQQASFRSHGSALFDMGVGTDFSNLYVNGRLAGPGSKVSVKYRFAPANGVFGNWSNPTDITSLQGQVSLGANFGRYVEIAYTIDDDGRESMSEGKGTSEIFGFLLDFTPLQNGGFCGTDPNVCQSAHCVQGVCCNIECGTQHQCVEATCATGTCQLVAKPPTTQCEDGDACTKTDVCAGPTKCENTGVACTGDAQCAPDKCIVTCAGTPYTCTPNDCQIFANCDGLGGCTYTNQNPGTLCTDAVLTDCLLATCDASGNCTQATTPAPENSQCAGDALACTNDYCDAAGTCSQHPVKAGNCVIDNICRSDGEKNVANACQECNSALDETNWSGSASGNPCDADQLTCTRDVCNGSGLCTHPIDQGWCLIAGQCVTGGAVNTSNDCELCDTARGQDKWSARSTGTACDDRNPCTKDTKCDNAAKCVGGIFDPNLPGCKCTDDSQCTTPGATHCNMAKGECVECVQDSHCGGGKTCNQVTFMCETARCQDDSDCSDPGKTHCRIAAGACVQCYLDNHCGAGKKCNTATFSCEDATSCQTDIQCRAADPARPICGPDGTCVECRDEQDCDSLDPPRPVCDQEAFTCVECLGHTDCEKAFPGTPFCRITDMVCLECLKDTDCGAGKWCDEAAGKCNAAQPDGGTDAGDAGKDAGKDTASGCSSNAQCGGATPVCNTGTGECVECLDSQTCVLGHPGKIYCSTTLQKCVECLTSYTCKGGKTCSTSTGTCVGGTTDDTGQPADDAGEPAQDGGGTTPAGDDAGEAAAEEIKNPYGCMCSTLTLE